MYWKTFKLSDKLWSPLHSITLVPYQNQISPQSQGGDDYYNFIAVCSSFKWSECDRWCEYCINSLDSRTHADFSKIKTILNQTTIRLFSPSLPSLSLSHGPMLFPLDIMASFSSLYTHPCVRACECTYTMCTHTPTSKHVKDNLLGPFSVSCMYIISRLTTWHWIPIRDSSLENANSPVLSSF